jgi:hypothetical protein
MEVILENGNVNILGNVVGLLGEDYIPTGDLNHELKW